MQLRDPNHQSVAARASATVLIDTPEGKHLTVALVLGRWRL
jgi:hypothetical protein